MDTTIALWLPTRPLSLIDMINRRAAATGSPRYASLAESADYNGHHVGVTFNDYRRYWVAEYTWAGRVVIGRGSLEECLRAAKREYDRGAKGATVCVYVRNDEERAIAEGFGFVPYSKEIEKVHRATYEDARFEKIHEAADMEKWGHVPGALGLLANSKTVEEFEMKCDDWRISVGRKPRTPSGPRLEDI
jgi:hypothetical protein